MRRLTLWLLEGGTAALLISALVGCGAGGSSGGGGDDAAGAEDAAGPAAAGRAADLVGQLGAAAQVPPDEGAPAVGEPAPGDAALVREKAAVGVGEKGHDLGEGLVSTPVKVYFQTRERVVFEIQIPSTMNLYKAEYGRGPRSHEEFMEKIIKEGMIRLPDLPTDHRYVYDPERGELLVEHP